MMKTNLIEGFVFYFFIGNFDFLWIKRISVYRTYVRQTEIVDMTLRR